MKTVIVRTEVETQNALKQQGKLNDSVAETSELTNDLTQSLDNMTGGAITFGKKLVSSAKGGIRAMGLLKTAIISTGIGALVVAVGSLVSYFTATEAGSRKLDKAMAAIGATVDVLIDRFSTFGEGVYLLLTGEVSQAMDLFSDATKNITAEIQAEAGAAFMLEEQLQKLTDREIELITLQAERERQIKELNKTAEDVTKSDEERVEAAREAIRLEEDLLKRQIDIANERARIEKEQQALGESSTEDRRRLAELQAEASRLETASLERRTTLTNKLNILEKTLFDQRQKEAERARQQEVEEIERRGFADIESDPRLTREQLLQQKLLESNKRFEEEKTKLEVAAANQRAAELEQIEVQKQNALNSALAQGLQAAIMLSEQGSIQQKAFAAAAALIDTYAAIAGQLKAFSGIPVPGYAIAQAFATGAVGFAQVRNILKTNPKSGGSPSIGGGSASGGAFPQQQNNVPDFGAINQGIGGTQNSSFNNRAYVVNRDIRRQSALEERLNDLARVS